MLVKLAILMPSFVLFAWAGLFALGIKSDGSKIFMFILLGASLIFEECVRYRRRQEIIERKNRDR